MDIKTALEMADESKKLGYTYAFDLALQCLAEHIRCADRKAREEIIDLIEKYKVPVGNSAAGEMACEFTMDALADIRDAIRATITD